MSEVIQFKRKKKRKRCTVARGCELLFLGYMIFRFSKNKVGDLCERREMRWKCGKSGPLQSNPMGIGICQFYGSKRLRSVKCGIYFMFVRLCAYVFGISKKGHFK